MATPPFFQMNIVLDTGFGDSGKGVVVNNLCNPNSLVIRFSGGQQCGHTVIHNGIKHVFSNFGSGTLKGCPTFFTEDTTFYPVTIYYEKNVLLEKGISPVLYIHPHAKLTTPYDVLYNRWLESKNNHGSCGLGVGATMKRMDTTPYKLYAHDLLAPKRYLEQRLESIKNYYRIFIDDFDEQVKNFDQVEIFNNLVFSDKFDFEILDFKQVLIKNNFNLVFEGSQGILLDMDHGIFPNVTYANTTCKNALKYVGNAYSTVNFWYVTRCYQTRHGNGWMSDTNDICLIRNEEEINVYNKYQGDFRVKEIDYDLIKYAISINESYCPRNCNPFIPQRRGHLVVTCLDQRPDFEMDYGRCVTGNIEEWCIYNNNSPHSGNMEKIKDFNVSL